MYTHVSMATHCGYVYICPYKGGYLATSHDGIKKITLLYVHVVHLFKCLSLEPMMIYISQRDFAFSFGEKTILASERYMHLTKQPPACQYASLSFLSRICHSPGLSIWHWLSTHCLQCFRKQPWNTPVCMASSPKHWDKKKENYFLVLSLQFEYCHMSVSSGHLDSMLPWELCTSS